MISAGDLRRGITIEMEGSIYQIMDFQHVKTARGAAFVRTKVRNIMTGTIKDITFNPNDRYPIAHIERKEMQYLYTDGTLYYFMDNETYDQLPLDEGQVKDAIQYIKENDNAIIRFYQGKPFEVEAPNFVELAVSHTEPGVKGDTATGATKPATLETGFTLNVPLFINIGDVIKVDTRTGEYLSRI